jgi:hypothetical protein
VYTIVTKYVWNGSYGISYETKLALAAALSNEYGFGIVTENFIPSTEGVISLRTRGVEAAVCPATRSAARAGINTDGTFVSHAATCDNPPSQFCLTRSEC